MKQIRFVSIPEDENDFSKILKLGADGFTHSRYVQVYPHNICIITDCDIEDLDLTLEIELPNELISQICYSEPEFGLTLLDALHEVKANFEVPEIGIKFIYTE